MQPEFTLLFPETSSLDSEFGYRGNTVCFVKIVKVYKIVHYVKLTKLIEFL